MKRIILFALIITFGITSSLKAQDKTKVYMSVASEMIFSFASIDDNGYDKGNKLRWSPVLNLQGMVNFDFGNVFGIFTGLANRNVGFTYQPPDDNYYYIYRTYNIGIPVGIKLGSLRKFFFYGGYEVEFPFNYKEKSFEGSRSGKQSKDVYWFSNRVENIQQSFLVGIQFPYGFNVKFKYYITNFHNKDFTTVDDTGAQIKPYENLNSNIFYISLNIGLFSPLKEYYDPDDWR